MKSSKLVKAGGATSVAYIFVMLIWAWSQSSNLRALEPNEFGDLLAGIFSPLAFLWLVLGYFQQGNELKASVKALELQGKELKNSVEQQRALVDVSTKQLEADYEARREADAAKEHAAQPRFQCSYALNQVGQSLGFTFHFENRAATCTEIAVFLENEEQATALELIAGARISFQKFFPKNAPLEALNGYLDYLDSRGSQRRQAFDINVRETTPGQPQSYESASMDRRLLRPPFDND